MAPVSLGIGPLRAPWIWALGALFGLKMELGTWYVPAPTMTSSPAFAAETASVMEQGFFWVHSVPLPPGATYRSPAQAAGASARKTRLAIPQPPRRMGREYPQVTGRS